MAGFTPTILACLLAVAVGLAAAEDDFVDDVQSAKVYDENVTPFIIGGHDAAKEQFPQIVSLQVRTRRGNAHICGGSILDPSWILTAAHCIDGLRPSQMSILAGTTNQTDESSGVRRRISQFVSHGGYTGDRITIIRGRGGFAVNDIALLKLAEPLELSDNIRLTTLDKEETSSGEKVVVAGWGQTSNSDSSASPLLQYVELQMLSRRECQSAYGLLPRITDDQICAVSEDGVQSDCSGDSGGPLMKNGRQVGIVSWSGRPCGPTPGVYASIAAHHPWIREKSGLSDL